MAIYYSYQRWAFKLTQQNKMKYEKWHILMTENVYEIATITVANWESLKHDALNAFGTEWNTPQHFRKF